MQPSKSPKRKAVQQDVPAVAELPEAVLAMILQHIPLWQRLSTCALVCKAWNTAVTSTTGDVDYELCRVHERQQLQTWLQQCGEQVVSMELTATTAMKLAGLSFELPCDKLSHLERLSVAALVLQLRSGQAHVSTRSSRSRTRSVSCPAAALGRAGPTSGFLPKLQQLKLEACSMLAQHFLQLSKLTALDSLHVDSLSLLTHTNKPVRTTDRTLQTVLQQLTKLSSLTLIDLAVGADDAAASALAPISSMQHLQHLVLDDETCSNFAALLPVLPTSLAVLQLNGVDVTPSLEHMQAFSRLGSLQELELTGVWMDPQVLCACSPQLKRLILDDCECTTGQDPFPDNNEAVSTLLSALARLTQLQTLHLTNIDFDLHPHSQQFSALTASSHLTLLRLTDHDYGLMPIGALQHMLPAGKQLPQLRVLHLSSCGLEVGPVTAADLVRIGSCCPRLEELHLEHVVGEGDDFSGLLPLQSSLTSLWLQGSAFGDAAAAVVAQLTDLRTLTWKYADDLSDVGMQQLTALRQLRNLYCSQCDYVAMFANPAAPPIVGHMGCVHKGFLRLSLYGKAPNAGELLARMFAAAEACSQQRRKTRAGRKRSR